MALVESRDRSSSSAYYASVAVAMTAHPREGGGDAALGAESAAEISGGYVPLKKRTKSTCTRQSTPLPETPPDAAPAELYCICRQPGSDERAMIACDTCDDWFHADCVGVSEDSIRLIDRFVCPLCEPSAWRSPV